MTANGKVLTVSYGAFSCRLIGFADPWAALRALPALGRLSEAEGGREGPQARALQLWAEQAFGPGVQAERAGRLITLRAPVAEGASGQTPAAPGATLHALPPLRPGPALAQRLAALRAGEAQARLPYGAEETPPKGPAPAAAETPREAPRLPPLDAAEAPAPPPPRAAPAPPARRRFWPWPLRAKAAPLPKAPAPMQALPRTLASVPSLASRPGEAVVARLVAEADTALAGPERRARFAALSFLRSAFSAVLGGRAEAQAAAHEAATSPYRQTLARLLGRGNAATALPQKPAPLVLTAKARRRRGPKRRAKRKAAAISAALAPRPAVPHWGGAMGGGRARGPLALKPAELAPELAEAGEADDALLFDPADFARFATKLGAASAEDWVEAAGAYAMLVDCHPGFSPAGLLRQLAALPAGLGGAPPPGPEAALAAFHRLIASGKIERRRYGHYVMTADSEIFRRAFAG